MALTINMKARGHIGPMKANVAEVTFDSSYPTGGEAVTANDFGLNYIVGVFVSSEDGKAVEFDRTNSKLLVRVGDNDAGSDGPFAEVANGSNQSTLAISVLVVGH